MNFQTAPRQAQRWHMGGRWRPPAITVWALRGRHKITRQVPPSRKRGLSADVGDLSICLAAIFLSVSLGQAEALLGVAKTPRTQAAPNPPPGWQEQRPTIHGSLARQDDYHQLKASIRILQMPEHGLHAIRPLGIFTEARLALDRHSSVPRDLSELLREGSEGEGS